MSTFKFTYSIAADNGWQEAQLPTTSTTLKFTHVRNVSDFQGDLVGRGVDESTFCYLPSPEGEMYCAYSGILHFEGTVKGEKSEAIFITQGMYTKADGPKTEWTLVEKSCTGAFEGMKGKGADNVIAPGGHGMEGWIELTSV